MKWLYLVLSVVILGAFALAFLVTRIENAQSLANKQLLLYEPMNQATDSTTAVVVFSRSGNTGVLADHIANKTSGDLYEITADTYQLGIPGWISALKDARSNVADITPSQIDLSQYKTVYLGSPIWLYSPAPPIWQFVKDNDLTGKHVVLVNSFNSKFEQSFIDDFAELVKAQGAVSFTHKYVKRGRMGNQLTTAQMLEKYDQQ
ncbi:flavodoxin family protein [Litoribrevibacter albus]|uniref:Flavodoxin-like domain-containing protein n=1 Tax=Litoribrevibacter albus TaxID=1473156 RepID=A0AA37W6P5_9GAMM|nr:flavodoxin [Litoribrevibacter albus]GLQ30403.1 hypothetical protein GCM10007876_08810 [Litoribrevibacter albus]